MHAHRDGFVWLERRGFRGMVLFALLFVFSWVRSGGAEPLFNTTFNGRVFELEANGAYPQAANEYSVVWGNGPSTNDAGWIKGSKSLSRNAAGILSGTITLTNRMTNTHFVLAKQSVSGFEMVDLLYPSLPPPESDAVRGVLAQRRADMIQDVGGGFYTGAVYFNIACDEDHEFSVFGQGVTNYTAWEGAYNAQYHGDCQSFAITSAIPAVRTSIYDAVKTYLLARLQKNKAVLQDVCDESMMKYLVGLGLDDPSVSDLLITYNPGMSEIRVITTGSIQSRGVVFACTVSRLSEGADEENGDVLYFVLATFTKDGVTKACHLWSINTLVEPLRLAGVTKTGGPKSEVVPHIRSLNMPSIYTEW